MKLIHLSKKIFDFPKDGHVDFLDPLLSAAENISIEILDIFKGNNHFIALNKNGNGYYYIIISARFDENFGHIYVSWGKNSESKMRCEYDGVGFGYYPKSLTGPRRFYDIGVLTTEEERHPEYKKAKTKNLVVRVDKEVYDRTIHTREYWRKYKDDNYFLLGNNCMTFVADIAEDIGLKIPKDIMGATDYIDFPWRYLQELIDLNE